MPRSYLIKAIAIPATPLQIGLAAGICETTRVQIVIINYPTAPAPYAPDYRTHHLARLWVDAGHHVTIVGASYSHLHASEVPVTSAFLELQEHGVRWLILKTRRYSGSGIGRVINLLTSVARTRTCERAITAAGADVALAASVYQLDNYGAARIARRHNGIFVRETRDLWPKTLLEIGGIKPSHPFVRLVQHAEDYGYRHADIVTSTLPNALEHMRTRGLTEDRWRYMAQCPNPYARKESNSPDAAIPAEHAAAIAAARAGGQFIVMFTGTFVPAGALHVILEAAELLNNEPVKFLFIGRGPLEAELRARIADRKINTAAFLPGVPRAAVPPLLAQADAAVCVFHDKPIYRYGVSPNKVFEYMDAAVPVIFSVGAKTDPITESGGGLVVPPANAPAIADAVRKLMRLTPGERQTMGQKARAHLHQNHDLRAVAADYIAQFTRLLAARRNRR